MRSIYKIVYQMLCKWMEWRKVYDSLLLCASASINLLAICKCEIDIVGSGHRRINQSMCTLYFNSDDFIARFFSSFLFRTESIDYRVGKQIRYGFQQISHGNAYFLHRLSQNTMRDFFHVICIFSSLHTSFERNA